MPILIHMGGDKYYSIPEDQLAKYKVSKDEFEAQKTPEEADVEGQEEPSGYYECWLDLNTGKGGCFKP